MPRGARGYMLDKPPPPGPWKLFLDQTVIPSLIDAVAAAEAGVERTAIAARARPFRALAAALGSGYALGRLLRRRP